MFRSPLSRQPRFDYRSDRDIVTTVSTYVPADVPAGVVTPRPVWHCHIRVELFLAAAPSWEQWTPPHSLSPHAFVTTSGCLAFKGKSTDVLPDLVSEVGQRYQANGEE